MNDENVLDFWSPDAPSYPIEFENQVPRNTDYFLIVVGVAFVALMTHIIFTHARRVEKLKTQ